jgi:hypothetical protein
MMVPRGEGKLYRRFNGLEQGGEAEPFQYDRPYHRQISPPSRPAMSLGSTPRIPQSRHGRFRLT